MRSASFSISCLLGLALVLALPVAGFADQEVSVDVACDANTFVFQGPADAAGPDGGASFVVQGVIYQAGTFDLHGAGRGLLPDGTPEFPDRVIGRWTCQGHFVGEGFDTATGVFVVTTQLYDLDNEHPGAETLVSHGVELIDLGVPFERAVTGGTGSFRRAQGEVTQKALAVNATGLFNFTFQFDLE
jgi:hypothetical protein